MMMRNRGTAAVLAMIFLVVFAVLGVSFYTMATTSLSVAGNDRSGQKASAAAESGVAFFQRLVGDVIVTESKASGELAMGEILTKLQTLNGKPTMGGKTIAKVGDEIRIPSTGDPATEWIALDADGSQRVQATISFAFAAGESPTSLYPKMRLVVTGWDDKHKDIRRTVAMTLVPRDRTLEVFSYGVFAKGRVDLADGKASILGEPDSAGSLGSAYTGSTAIYLRGGAISGEVAVSGDPDTLFVTKPNVGSIGGVDITDAESLAEALKHVRQVEPPTIPLFQPNQFYSTSLTKVPEHSDLFKGKAYSDICITENMKFTGTDVLEGTIYVKPGVTLDFSGGPVIRGVIIVEDPNQTSAGVPIPGSNYTSTSTLYFHGTPIFEAPVWPSGSVVSAEQQAILDDYSMMGPSAYVYIQGNTSSNKANEGFAKTVVCGTLEEFGSGMIKVRDGTLITMSDTAVTGTEGFSGYYDGDGVRIQRTPGYTPPLGGYTHLFSWVVDPKTYQEVTQ